MVTAWSLTVDVDGERDYHVTESEPDLSPALRLGQCFVVGQTIDPFAFYTRSNFDGTKHTYSTRAIR